MKKMSISDIQPGWALTGHLCHKNGEILHAPGDIITRIHLALLRESEIDDVILLDADEDPSRMKETLQLKQVVLNNIPLDEPVPTPLFDEAGGLVVNKDQRFTSLMLNKCLADGKTFLSYRKDPMELQSFQSLNYRMLLDSDKLESLALVTDPAAVAEPMTYREAPSPASAPDMSIPDERFLHFPTKQISLTLCKSLMEQPAFLTVALPNAPEIHAPAQILEERTRETTTAFKRRYMKWTADTDTVFNQLKANRETRFEDVEAIARDIMSGLFEDRFYCCNLMNLRHPPTSDKYLSFHAVNVAIACSGAAALMGYPMQMVRELTVGALLHDIGHQLTFRQLLAKKELDAEEQHKYIQHVTVGTAMLKNITKVPISTMLMVVQHHEWLDGSGRIFHAAADRQHDFSRLLMVADYYESSCRFLGPSAAMTATIGAVQTGKLDAKFLKALLLLLSVFPIGVSLRTAADTICKVIGLHDSGYKKPILRSIYIMKDDHLFPIDKQELVDLKNTEVKIVGELSHSALTSDISVGFRCIE